MGMFCVFGVSVCDVWVMCVYAYGQGKMRIGREFSDNTSSPPISREVTQRVNVSSLSTFVIAAYAPASPHALCVPAARRLCVLTLYPAWSLAHRKRPKSVELFVIKSTPMLVINLEQLLLLVFVRGSRNSLKQGKNKVVFDIYGETVFNPNM